ncbi:hypothetical protein D3C71_1896160 [compost metagenome]
MDRNTPMLANPSNVRCVACVSSMATDSVISHSSCDASTPWNVNAAPMRSANPLSRNWCTDRLMATRMRMPLRAQSAIWRQASSMTHAPS